MSEVAHEIATQIKKIDAYLEDLEKFNNKIQQCKAYFYENEIDMLTELKEEMVIKREELVKEFEAEFNKLSKEDLIKEKYTREEMLNDPFMDHDFNTKLVKLFAENHGNLMKKIETIGHLRDDVSCLRLRPSRTFASTERGVKDMVCECPDGDNSMLCDGFS